MITQPKDGETVNEAPDIKANLATFGNVDPESVTMRISGLGLVPATYDPETKLRLLQDDAEDSRPPSYGDRESPRKTERRQKLVGRSTLAQMNLLNRAASVKHLPCVSLTTALR